MPFPLIRAEGPPRHVGFVHGREAGDAVDRSVRLYKTLFSAVANLSWDEVLELASRFEDIMRSYDAGLWQEINGIAEGSEQPLGAIVALNARTDILRLAGKSRPRVDLEGCTAAVCLPESTADGRVLLSQNWDTHIGCFETTVVLEIKGDRQPDVLLVTEAGIVMRSGLNSSGLGVTGNALRSDQDHTIGLGVPVSMLRRRMLTHHRAADAATEVEKIRRSHANNHLIADARGEAVNVEAAPRHLFPLYPKEGVLVHTNHFLHEDSREQLTDENAASSSDSFWRRQQVRRHLWNRRGKIEVSDVQTAFRNHHGFPRSVCKHPDASEEGAVIATVASLIMDLTNLRFLVARGPVCENEFYEYSFS